MGLLFGNTNDSVNHGDDASVQDIFAGTALFWIKPNTAAEEARLLEKSATFRIEWRPDSTPDRVLFVRTRAGVDLRMNVSLTNFAAYGTDKWLFVAFVWDQNGADGDQRVLVGDLAARAAEPSSYLAQTVGDSAVDTDVGTDLTIFGHGGVEFNGIGAWAGLWSRVLTTGEIHEQQSKRRPTANNVLFTEYGYNGTGTQPDWSGNGNNGTVTGATVTDHVPIPFRRAGSIYVPATVSTLVTVTGIDSLALGLSEAQPSLDVTVSAAESCAVQIAEATALQQNRDAADTLGLSATEAAFITIALTATDSLALALSEAATILASLAPADSLAARIDEDATLDVTLSAADSVGVRVSEVVALLARLDAADVISLSASEAAAVVVVIQAVDTLALQLVEAGLVEATDLGDAETAESSTKGRAYARGRPDDRPSLFTPKPRKQWRW